MVPLSHKTDVSASEQAALTGNALVDNLAQLLQTRIMTGELPIGTRLRQEALAEEFGVSRTPVREALRQLQSSGMLEVQPRRGAVVRGPSARDIREAYFVRAELEGIAAELAAELITDDQLARLREAAGVFRSAVEHFIPPAKADGRSMLSDEGWPAANDLFHTVILESCDNQRLYETVKHLHLGLPRNLTWLALSQSSRLLSQNVEEHDEILRAIEARKPIRARGAMSQHISRSGELVARRYERDETTAAA